MLLKVVALQRKCNFARFFSENFMSVKFEFFTDNSNKYCLHKCTIQGDSFLFFAKIVQVTRSSLPLIPRIVLELHKLILKFIQKLNWMIESHYVDNVEVC